jgi:hypothetical protein
MRKKDREFLVNDYRIITVEPVQPKEDESIGFFGWVGIILVVLIVGGWLMGGH